METPGCGSSSAIVAAAFAVAITRPAGCRNLSRKVSSASSRVSPRIVTVTVWLNGPEGEKLSVPER